MQRLRWKQTQSVLSALDVLYSDVEPDTLPLRILDALNTALASETVMVDAFGGAGEMRSLAQYPSGLMPPREYAMLAHNLPHHPLFARVILKRETAPLRMSDAVGPGFKKTALYNEVMRPLSITDQVVVGIGGPHDTLLTCCLSRVKGGYDESERQMVHLLRKHFASAAESARLLRRLRSAENHLQSALRAMRRGVIVLTRNGRVGYATESAAALMEQYFGRGTFGEKRLPREVESWLRGAGADRRDPDYRPPLAPLKAHGPGGELSISLAPAGATGERMLLVEEKPWPSPEGVRALGLTRREAEVLFWVAQGKTDWETGSLCGISPRTVQVHLTRIYAKLGVENRTAATLKVLALWRT